jgi:uncharacterized membrane protein YbhN (UPF0104 family)
MHPDELITQTSQWRRLSPYVITLAILGVFLLYLISNADQYQNLFQFSWNLFLLSCALVVVILGTNGFINYVLYRDLGASVGLLEAISLAAVNTLANQLPFAAGMIAKGVYLKRRYRLAYGRYLSATVALYLIFLATAGVAGVTVLGGRQLLSGVRASPLLLAGFAIMASSLAALWLPLQRLPLPARWERQFGQIWAGWGLLQEQKSLVFKIVVVYLVMMVALGGRYWIAFHLLSQPVTFSDTLLFSAASILTQLVSTTPGGLGVREAIVSAVAFTLGFDPAVSAVAVGLDRIIATGLTLALGSLASYHLTRHISSYPVAEPETEIT